MTKVDDLKLNIGGDITGDINVAGRDISFHPVIIGSDNATNIDDSLESQFVDAVETRISEYMLIIARNTSIQ